jgi:hypothetical protein
MKQEQSQQFKGLDQWVEDLLKSSPKAPPFTPEEIARIEKNIRVLMQTLRG